MLRALRQPGEIPLAAKSVGISLAFGPTVSLRYNVGDFESYPPALSCHCCLDSPRELEPRTHSTSLPGPTPGPPAVPDKPAGQQVASWPGPTSRGAGSFPSHMLAPHALAAARAVCIKMGLALLTRE
jgi:hypothetical protein